VTVRNDFVVNLAAVLQNRPYGYFQNVKPFTFSVGSLGTSYFWFLTTRLYPTREWLYVSPQVENSKAGGLIFLSFALHCPRRESPLDRIPFYLTSARCDNGVNCEYRSAPEPRRGTEAGIRVLVAPGGHSSGIWSKQTRTTKTFSV
jgi:hypothetical protein